MPRCQRILNIIPSRKDGGWMDLQNPSQPNMFAETRSHTHRAIAENGVLVAYLVLSMKIHRENEFDHEIWGVNPAKFSSPNHDSSPKMALM
jgi:hypothetical protein